MAIKQIIQDHLAGIRQHLDYLTKSPGERTSREMKDICDCIIYLAEAIKIELCPVAVIGSATQGKSLIRYAVGKQNDGSGITELIVFENGNCCSIELNADELAGLVKTLTEVPNDSPDPGGPIYVIDEMDSLAHHNQL